MSNLHGSESHSQPRTLAATELSLRLPDVLTPEDWTYLMAALRLSPREADILRAGCYDESLNAIAYTLGLSTHTVHTYRSRLYRKLGVRSFAQALSIAFTAYVRILPFLHHEVLGPPDAAR